MHTSPHERMAAAGGAAAIVALLGAALIAGLDVPVGQQVDRALVLLRLQPAPPPPPPRREVVTRRSPAAKHKPSPRNLRNRATPVVVPPPIVRLPPPPPPIIAAPAPDAGMAPQTGASDRAGPGEGAGGNGNGRGGGGEGGQGEGDVAPEQISGEQRSSDIPRRLRGLHVHAVVGVIYRVGVDGRASDCRITRPSDYPDLDAATCAMIVDRFRFRPAMDGEGHPVASHVYEDHTWDVR